MWGCSWQRIFSAICTSRKLADIISQNFVNHNLLKLINKGIPGSVSNLEFVRQPYSNILTARWDSVFSLDLNDTEPDIVYGVEVYDITCGRNDLIHNDTAITNSTSNTIDPTQLYRVAITPRNNVKNAINGNSSALNGRWLVTICLVC